MSGVRNLWRTGSGGALVAACLLAGSPAAAQIVASTEEVPAIVDTRASDPARPTLFAETMTRVFKDPTTYALPPIVYAAHRLDWDSSQKLFARGYVEANPDFTVTGHVNDIPISHQAGKRRILRYSASMIGRSVLNNATCAVVERRLIARAPQHRKLIRTLGWVERSFATTYWSYRLTHNQVGQWRENDRMLAGLRALPASPAPN
jgi:hypothetical protein